MKNNPPSVTLSRRGFIGTGAAFAGASGSVLIGAAVADAAETKSPPAAPGRKVISTDSGPIVETQYGRVRGSIRNGIYSFKGVPYGADTGGDNRWMMAKRPISWTGVRSTTCYTHTCPTTARAGWEHDEERFVYDWSDGIPGEDMLSLSIWTPGINDNRKRPVFVWIHGGGYSGGSNEELKSYDGERLARRGDILVVSINHRLNILGFLNLEKFGDQYKNSQNVSQLDLVSGLEWIRDNIASFGGDPAAVTIFGQSGGGGKVAYLMGMPSAKGLFRAAAIESASQPRVYTQADSVDYSDRVLRQLGISSAADLAKLHAMPYAQLLAGMRLGGGRGAATPTPGAAAAPPLRPLSRGGNNPAFQPSTGPVIPELPFYPNSPALSANIPLVVGGALNEFSHALDTPTLEKLTKDEIVAAIERALPGKGVRLYAAFQGLKLPGRGVPFDVYSQAQAIAQFRLNSVDICKTRATARQAPVYNYQVRWQSPAFDGRPRAFHCSGLQFVFDNVERCANATGGGPDAQAVADAMSEAFIAFVKTGNPNHKGIPQWDAVSSGKVNTMVFDNKMQLAVNFDAEELAVLAG